MHITPELTAKFCECYSNKVRNAKQRQLEFSLPLVTFVNIKLQTTCAYSGELFEESSPSDSASLERIDNALGYVPGNVIAVKTKYNQFRSNYTIEDIEKIQLELIGRINQLKLAIDERAQLIVTTTAEIDDQILYNMSNPIATRKYKIPAQHYSLWVVLQNNIAATHSKIKDREIIIEGLNKILQDKKLANNKRIKYNDQLKAHHTKCANYKKHITVLQRAFRNKTGDKLQYINSTKIDMDYKLPSLRKKLDGYTKLINDSIKLLGEIEEKFRVFEIVKNGMKRFESLDPIDKEKLVYGLPLETSYAHLTKHKLGYNYLLSSKI